MNTKMITKLIGLLGMVLIGVGVNAQVGINTALPDTSAVLDLSGPDNKTRGLLIPTIDTVGGKDLVITPRANGLLVFDAISSEFYFWQTSDSVWYSLNRWQAADKTNHIYTLTDSVGIGTTNPSEKLDITGNVKVSGNINATQKIKESGNELLPEGSIIMWYGVYDSIPAGWGLCDGTTYAKLDGGTIQSPDLQGKFVVGYNKNGVGDYGAVNNTGGAESIKLSATESGMPLHGHANNFDVPAGAGAHIHAYDVHDDETDISVSPNGNFRAAGEGGYKATNSGSIQSTLSTHDHSITGDVTDALGIPATAFHENRPPYYVLAYIIKL